MRRVAACLLVVALVVGVAFGGDLPEGWTTDGQYAYSSAIVVQNLSDTAAVVNVTYKTPCDPTTPDYTVTVPGGMTKSLNVNDAMPGPWEGAAVVTSDTPIAATQTFLWQDPNQTAPIWASNSGGVTAPATTWYLAEGSTYGGFQTYISLQNPGETPAVVATQFVTPGSVHDGPNVALDPFGQTTINVGDTLPDWSSVSTVVKSDVPVIAQSTVYWNGGASSTTAMGVSQPATTWYLAEGTTASSSGFETWYTVQNVGDSQATVNIDYVSDGQQYPGTSFTVPPMDQTKVNAADSFPEQSGFGAIVTSDQPIVAVQSMTWNGNQGYDRMTGVPEPKGNWYFPDACKFQGASTWVAVQNMGGSSATVTIDYTGPGDVPDTTLSLDPFAKDTVSLSSDFCSSGGGSITVSADQPIVAVLGTYSDSSYGSQRNLSPGLSQTSTQWFLPAVRQDPWSMGTGTGSVQTTEPDRDGDGVPDAEDYCPDFPGSPDVNGC